MLLFAQQPDKRKEIDIDGVNRPLKGILEEIRTKTGSDFIYDDLLLKNIKVTVKIKEKKTEDALRKILSGSGLSFKLFDKNSFVIFRKKKQIDKPVATVVMDKPVIQEDSINIATPAELLTSVKLAYPALAVNNRQQGNVGLKIIINKSGDVCKATVEQSSGYAILDSAAVDYARRLKYIPASYNGKPRSCFFTIICKYTLNE